MDTKARFSNRVNAYAKYRPSYPAQALDYLFDVVGVYPQCTVADIGAGTGIFSALLLDRDVHVAAVEPNGPMREEANRQLGEHANYSSYFTAAENTGLPSGSIDFIVCAQAFHWFNREAAHREFLRILKPNGKVILIWNSRLTQGTAFLEQYEALLHEYGHDYKEVNHKNITFDDLKAFFRDGRLQLEKFPNRQLFDFAGLSGRLMSSSYCPTADDPRFEEMMRKLRTIFEKNQEEGYVHFDYETEVYWGEV
ncbi:class I SAM-dependent methyltransferase [Paenibacillus sp. J5C_2022]|uniref:class I SAM-dependent methyltransferase n=1 Tax=Paenibacillus sp. J5C2022 TaxID=2977129 RepID=UPI0021D06E7B|nr:class I SAM-dependent methyltransferase [Paenibacillus sp. J5C2022]MCU6712798.1 class I SAM-dependent methyltransferase [Paenibacillus sp. J5C2022]